MKCGFLFSLLLVMFVSCNSSKEKNGMALDSSGVQLTLKPNQMNFFGINSPTTIDSLLDVINHTNAVTVKTFNSKPCDGITTATYSSSNEYHVTNDVLLYGVPCEMDINIWHNDKCINNDWIRDITFHSTNLDFEKSKKIINNIKAYYKIYDFDIDAEEDTILHDVDIFNCIISFNVQRKNMRIRFMNYRP